MNLAEYQGVQYVKVQASVPGDSADSNTIAVESSSGTIQSIFTIGTDYRSGGSDSDHLKAPVFGKSLHTPANQAVDYGFYHNPDKYAITDNWHTPFEKITISTGTAQTFGIKVCHNDPIRFAQMCLVPEVGMLHKAELYLQTELNPYDVTIKEV